MGHPHALLRRQALALAREATSWLVRLVRRGKTLRAYLGALEDRYYLEPGRYRTVPRGCPSCGFRGARDLPWWLPGSAYPQS